MSKRQAAFGAGDWIAVPLEGGWAVGLIARMGRLGACLGYFFPPLLKEIPTLEMLRSLRSDQAVLVTQFMSAQLQDGEWPVLGRIPDWDPHQWPVPKFRYQHHITGKRIIREYDDDLNYRTEQTGVSEDAVSQLPNDGTSYGGALQLDLADRLGTQANVGDAAEALMSAANDPPRHFLYFRDKELADNAANICRELDYNPVLEESVDAPRPWLLLVQHKRHVATEEEMERAGKRLAEVAEEWGGEYDGWDKPV